MITTHIAGPLGADHIQRCSRCGLALKDNRTPTELGVDVATVGSAHLQGVLEALQVAIDLAAYPVDALVDVGPSWQAMRLSTVQPDHPCAGPAVVAVQWKDEDEVNDEPVGPMVLLYADGRREDKGWQTRKTAAVLARRHNARFEAF
jgi:hypothetical protein